jgi:hypothetical protein
MVLNKKSILFLAMLMELVCFSVRGQQTGQLSICSKLDFSDLDWPNNLSPTERDPFALALNISGSFEGEDGWQNLTNNFDGQGLSLGLLNQCLGQGSLQPLLIEMRDKYTGEMEMEFSVANFESLLNMLKQWQAAVNTTDERIDLADYGLSRLDDADKIEAITGFSPDKNFRAELTGKNQNSVDWAARTLYNKAAFKPDWATQLTRLSASQGYRSIQVNAALKLHTATMTLFKTFGLKLYRSYLFLFDIEVQNGGIPAEAMMNIENTFKANPQWNEVQKLDAILAERLKYVKKQYVRDVRERKESIINGTGTVHSIKRNYSKEFCTDLNHAMP